MPLRPWVPLGTNHALPLPTGLRKEGWVDIQDSLPVWIGHFESIVCSDGLGSELWISLPYQWASLPTFLS